MEGGKKRGRQRGPKQKEITQPPEVDSDGKTAKILQAANEVRGQQVRTAVPSLLESGKQKVLGRKTERLQRLAKIADTGHGKELPESAELEQSLPGTGSGEEPLPGFGSSEQPLPKFGSAKVLPGTAGGTRKLFPRAEMVRKSVQSTGSGRKAFLRAGNVRKSLPPFGSFRKSASAVRSVRKTSKVVGGDRHLTRNGGTASPTQNMDMETEHQLLNNPRASMHAGSASHAPPHRSELEVLREQLEQMSAEKAELQRMLEVAEDEEPYNPTETPDEDPDVVWERTRTQWLLKLSHAELVRSHVELEKGRNRITKDYDNDPPEHNTENTLKSPAKHHAAKLTVDQQARELSTMMKNMVGAQHQRDEIVRENHALRAGHISRQVVTDAVKENLATAATVTEQALEAMVKKIESMRAHVDNIVFPLDRQWTDMLKVYRYMKKLPAAERHAVFAAVEEQAGEELAPAPQNQGRRGSPATAAAAGRQPQPTQVEAVISEDDVEDGDGYQDNEDMPTASSDDEDAEMEDRPTVTHPKVPPSATNWASQIWDDQHFKDALLEGPKRFLSVMTANGCTMPRALCGKNKLLAEQYFMELLGAGLQPGMEQYACAYIWPTYLQKVIRDRAKWETHQPSAAAVIKAVTELKRAVEQEALVQGTPSELLQPTTDDKLRRRVQDFRKNLSSSANFSISQKATMKNLGSWEELVRKEARTTVGVDWEQSLEALTAISTLAFDKALSEEWLEETKAKRLSEKLDNGPEAKGWPYMLQWIKERIRQEVRDDELEARQALTTGVVRQNNQTVVQYVQNILRYTRHLPATTDKELIVWFMNGLNSELNHLCRCDSKGRPWACYASLKEHAVAKEMELLSRKRADRGEQQPRYEKKWNKSHRNKGEHVLAMHAQANKGAWVEAVRDKKRDRSPDPLQLAAMHHNGAGPSHGQGGGRGGGRGAGMASPNPHRMTSPGNGKVEREKKDWYAEIPGNPHAKCSRNPFITNEQAWWMGSKGMCFKCGLAMNLCKMGACKGTGQHKDPSTLYAAMFEGAKPWVGHRPASYPA